MSVITRLKILGVRTAIHIDRPPRVRPSDVEDVDPLFLGHIDELDSIRRDELPGPAAGFTTRMRLVAFKRGLTISVQRPGPRLKGNVFDLDVIRQMRGSSCSVDAVRI